MLTVTSGRHKVGMPYSVEYVDACVMGWIPGVTRTPDGPGLNLDHPEHRSEAAIRASEIRTLMEYGGAPKKRAQFPYQSDWARGEVVYHSDRGNAYNVGEMAAAELAWRLHDGRAADCIAGWELFESIVKSRGTHDLLKETRDEVLDEACWLIEGLEYLFSETAWADIAQARAPWRRPWIFVEGGLHLVSRAIVEVSRQYRFPSAALENTWLPGHFLLAPETGAAVNRWGMLYDRARACRVRGAPRRVDLVVGENLKPKRSVHHYNDAYPWLYSMPEGDELKKLETAGEEMVGRLPPHDYLILGQVPCDASVTMDGRDHTVESLVEHIGRFDAAATVVYRPHPMEQRSRLTEDRSATRFLEAASDFNIEGHVVDPSMISLTRQLELTKEGRVTVLTINSQAGLEAARTFDVVTLGRAFYDDAGITRKSLIHRAPSPSLRHERWAHYVHWLLEKLYVRKEELSHEFLCKRIALWGDGFRYFDLV